MCNTEIQAEEKRILQQRRETVLLAMRETVDFFWRTTEDVSYIKVAGGEAYVHLKAGRIYRGLPYTHAVCNQQTFVTLADAVDEHGVYTFSQLSAPMLNKGTSFLGNDCSASVWLAWDRVSTTISDAETATKTMTANNGYLHVGEYVSDPSVNLETKEVCKENGKRTMFAAYAQLQVGDAVVNNNDGAVHVMMVVKVRQRGVGEEPDCIWVYDQTSKNVRNEESYFDEKIGQRVYITGNIEKKLTFEELYDLGYLPITCLELVNVGVPVAEESVQDSVAELNENNFLTGVLTSNHAISCVKVAVYDDFGRAEQEMICYQRRGRIRTFDMEDLMHQTPAPVRGHIDLNALQSGAYRCTMNCVLATGTEILVRDFVYTKES